MKKNVAVIFGGKSAEHDVSIVTAYVPIINTLLSIDKYNVYPVYISKDGKWYHDEGMNSLNYFKSDFFDEKIKKLKPLQLLFDDGFYLVSNSFLFNEKIKTDIVFPAMHGTFGEDGSLMGILRMADVPFVGCDIFASTIAMDKSITKEIVSVYDIPVVPYVSFTYNDWQKDKSHILNKIKILQYPLFVKPVHLGSSIGIVKVNKEEDLENAIEVGFYYDNKIVVEECVQNLIEVTLPIIGNNDLQFGAIERPLNKSDFFTFDEKYLSDERESGYSELPANIDERLKSKVYKYGEMTYKILGCSGIARVDFLIDSLKNEVYVNEVNTLPGSLYHHNWKCVGVSNIDLINKLIDLAFEKYNTDKKISYTFKSEILKKTNSIKLQ